MSRATVGKWGKNLAIRVPVEVARATGLSDGEHVEVEDREGDILIRRVSSRALAQADARAAAEEIAADAKSHSLGGLGIRDLLDEGRRG
ncbi:MAG TPA: AbrB/MazE/SpoVT family DNA-binding domain-containing protein [Caulobacteraceae bacterium]|nr:AbrB/MazE/SpoVT family DNA-binding domain-containing protein [Caulobacteraceae bacterium]